MRGALSVELAPQSLSGIMFIVEPLLQQGRFASSSFSEYRFSVGVGSCCATSLNAARRGP